MDNPRDPVNDMQRYMFWYGTSASTPITSGIAALCLSVNPELTGSQLRKIITGTARDLEISREEQGAGLVDAHASVRAALGELPDLDDHPFETEIRTLVEEDVLSGFPYGLFVPSADLTRGQFAAVLDAGFDLGAAQESQSNDPLDRMFEMAFWSLDDSPPLSDIEDHWATESIERAVEAGYISGFSDGTFRPREPLTKTQALVAIASGQGYEGGNTADLRSRYPDADAIPDWAVETVAAVHDEWGSIPSLPVDDPSLQPTENASRAEVAKYIYEATR
jgi:hypothetical protein